MKDILEAIDTRVKSPLFGYYALSLIAINWAEFFYLIVDSGPAAERIAYFQGATNIASLIYYPLLSAIAYSILYPWIHYLSLWIGIKPTELKISLQARSEHSLIIEKQKLEEAHNKLLASTENELIDRAKRDAELNEIEDEEIRQKLQSEIEELREEREKIKNQLDEKTQTEPQPLTKEQEKILSFITKKGGEIEKFLVFNDTPYGKVKTEYYIEDLISIGYLKDNDYNESSTYALTTKAKKLMIEKGIA
jgi:primosomal protein N'